eukprot:9926164-Prorocentrum_lima.AAC.1
MTPIRRRAVADSPHAGCESERALKVLHAPTQTPRYRIRGRLRLRPTDDGKPARFVMCPCHKLCKDDAKPA